jgi:hypothetical protein
MTSLRLAVGTVLLLAATHGFAGVPEPVKTAASAAAHGVEVAERAVVHAVKVAASGVEYGAKKAGQAVIHVAKKIGLPTEPAAKPQE